MIKILVVEDDAFLLELEKELLTMSLKEKAEITTALNGKEALELCKENKFDLVLTDIDMPLMTGNELIDSVKNEYKEQVQKFYILTGFLPNIEQMKMKADMVFQKPIEIGKITQTILNDFPQIK